MTTQSFRRYCLLFSIVLAVLAGVTTVQAQVHMTVISPPKASPVINPVMIQGTGFPASATTGNTTVTITPPAGNGSAVTVVPTYVTPGATPNKLVIFAVPPSLTANQSIAGCQVSINANGVAAGNSLALEVDPPASLTGVTPGAGTRGTAVLVTITGAFTHFNNTSVVSTSAGGDIGISGFSLTDASHLQVLFTVSNTAITGIKSVRVKTGAEIANIANGFLVAANPAVSVAISPASGVQGTTFDVNVTGTNTTFTQGVTIPSFGDGVRINSTTVLSNTSATVNVSIDPIAFVGFRSFTITTGGEYGTLPNGFQVTQGPASLISILPTGGAQGASATIVFTGNSTHWVAAGSKVSFGGGIVVGNVSVTSPTSLSVNITVPPSAPAGVYSATVTTLGEAVTLPNAFTVTAATPYISNAAPNSAGQGATLDVDVVGTLTSFTATTPTANFGPNIAVNSITVADDTHLKINITITNTAFAGGRTVSLTSNATIFNFNFSVSSSAAAITGMSPASGLQGASVAISVTGVNTHWVDGLTQASLDQIWITVNKVKVTSATTAEVDITIASDAYVGARTLTLSTGGEVVSLNSFTVLPYTPTLAISPGSGMIGTTVPVVFNGNFTHWIPDTTVANISGQGVSILGFTVDTAWSAHASLVIDPTAPSNGCSAGNRTLTLTTVSGAIDEIVTAPFCVTSTPAYLTSITPGHTGVPVNNLLVDITGAYTHFDNTTQVGFGPNITVVGAVSVISPTHLQVVISVDANAALGYRQAFVNSDCASCLLGGPEQLTAGFLLDYPATSSLVSVSPSSGAQGQALTGVLITGNLTNWGPTTVPILGLGVTVSNVNVLSATTAMADITISPTTPTGGRSVVMITNNGGEVESGLSFSVTPGIASVSALGISTDCTNVDVCPAPSNTLANIHQGDTLSFRVIGVATHFLQGETILDFGPNIAITQVHVVDATHLYGQITVQFLATPGFRDFRAITDGEVAPSFSNSVNVLSSTGTINITPTSAPQGTTLDVTVNGIGVTHFNSVDTSATFGNNTGIVGQTGGISTLSGADITVVSATQAVLHVKVLGTAYCCTGGLRDFTITTLNVVGAPANVEQITLPLAFYVSQGAGIITQVTPDQDTQGHSVNIQVVGQNTNFQTGVTTAYLTTGGCSPANPAGAIVTNVTAADNLHATLAVAIDVNAATGIRGLCLYTQGEFVGFLNAFNVLPGVPLFSGVGPTSGLQGQTLQHVTLLGAYTHWTAAAPNPTTVTLGQGITVSNLQVLDNTHAQVDLFIDPIAQLGGRTVTVTTGTEVVSGGSFSVNPGPAILSSISPSHANQGQHVLMQVTGQFTHWAQGLTQFSIGGGDIIVNGFLIQNATSAVADLTLSPTAGLGTRTVTMSTAGEVVSLNQSFLVTGGIPSLISISPSSFQQCASGVNVQLAGAFTHWDSTTSVFMGPNITVTQVVRNSDTALTAVINVDCAAPLGVQGALVQTGSQGLAGQVQILSNAPPTPYMAYEYPSVALKGQTLSVSFAGAYTHWLPTGTATPTQVTFGAGITVNDFQVTSLTSATANITIQPTATVGSRTVVFTTGAETESTSFYVTVGTPAISLVDGPHGSSAIQGETLTFNLVGAYTTWNSVNPPTFTFGAGVTVVPGTLQIFGPTAARMDVTVDILASQGGRTVIATNGAEVAYGYFSVIPSSANISSVTPNTVMQGTSGFVTHVVGFSTHWDNTTSFTFGGGDVSVTLINVVDATHADVTLDLAPLAYTGLRSVTATTGGEYATLVNGFVVTPGTPILTNCVNCTPSSHVIQQNNFTASVLGQFTAFVAGWPAAGATTVDFGNGAIITSINVTGPQSIDVGGYIDPLAYVGCRDVTVTTGTQVMKLYGAFCIGYGPAVISQLSPNTAYQGATLNVDITGTNTHFCCVNPPNITVGTFGPGISLNTLTVTSPTTATANITIAANATVEQNTITLTTQGEIATIPLGFTIQSITPVVSFITPTSGTQGTALDITIAGAFTHWSLADTAADFGNGIAATVTAVPDNTHATVHLVISPTAPTGNHAVRMLTNLGGGSQEIAVYTIGAGNGTPGYFAVGVGTASISAATPTSPATVHQNDSGDIIAITGSGTHFTAATPVINFTCVGAPVAFQVVDDTHINATVNVSTFATTGPCGVTVTTGGEVASGSYLFNVLAGLPIMTGVGPTSAHQGNTLDVTVNGLYTHFTAASTVDFGAGITVNGAPTSVSATSATFNITIDTAAALTTRNVTVNSPGPETAVKANAFTVLAGVPIMTGISIPNGPQGLTQNEHITGLFTHWTSASVVSVSGTGVTVGNPPNAPDNFNLLVNFTVTVGAPAGPRTVTVTTGSEVVSLPSAFNVQPGTSNLSGLTPNIGVPDSTVNVTFNGVFTHFTNGATTANFGPGVSVNGFGFGNDGLLNVSDNFTATATLTLDPSATLGARNVVITTPAPPLASVETFTVLNGFTVQTTPSTPVVTFLSPSMGLSGTVNASNVPINTNITVVFNEPMSKTSITAANAFITDGTTQGGCWAVSGLPATVSMDLSGRVLTIQPTSLLGVGRDFYLQLNSYSMPGGTPTIQDASGTQNLGHYCQRFTTGFSQDATGPTFITGNIPASATGVPTNVHPTVGFDKPVNPATMSGLSFVQNPGSTPIPGTWSYSTDFTQYIFAPASALPVSTNFTLAYSNVLADSTGHVLTNPGSLSFTTGTGPDTGGNSVTSITPISNSTVGTNPLIRFTTAKPINPLTVTQFYVYNNVSGEYTYGAVTHSADFKTWDLHLPAPLDPSTQYRFTSYSMYDWAGNCCVSFSQYFYTGTATNVTGPTVTSVSPPDTATGIAVNAPVWVHFSGPLDPTSVPANAITVNGGAASGSVAFGPGPDYSTLVFTPAPNLAVSTTYSVAVAGVQDTSGNPMAPFAGSSFTTGASATVDSTRGNVTISPTGSSVPVNTNVVFQLNKPVNPLSVNSSSVRVYDYTIGHDVPGTVAVSLDLKTLTFTPSVNFPSQHLIGTWNGNPGYLYDLAGNQFNFAGLNFTTTTAVDLTAPTVISVTPPDTSTGIGPNNPVVVTFSKPINPGTLGNNVAMYTGSTLYTPSYSLSADATTIYFSSGTMPYATTYTVVVSPSVTDLAGNQLAAEFRSSFTTAPQPVVARPSVTVLRPGDGATGVPTTASVTFFTNAAMDTATVNDASVHVSQNGVLLNGAITFAANNQAITFTPASSFVPGSLIQIWFTSAATDGNGNALYDRYASFTVAPDLSTTPLAISSRGPCFGCASNYNTVVEVLFTKPVNPATVTSSSFFVRDSSNINPVNGAISFFDNNRGIRFTPNAPLAQNAYFYVYLTNTIQDTDNLNFNGSSSSYNYYAYTTTSVDTSAPFVTGIAPTNGAGNIGSNALVSVTFSENVDSLTLDPANVTLTGPGGSIPVSLSYNGSNFTMTITPQAPLPAGVINLQLNGVNDYSGNPLNPTPNNSSFTVVNAPDYAPPSLVQTSWQNGQGNVPVTSSFSVIFSKPIDLRSVVPNSTVYLQDATAGYPNIPVTLSWSAGNTVLLITPTAALNVGHQYRILVTSLADLNGNVSSTIVNSYFYTVLVAPAGGPVITQFVPPAGLTNVPENFKPQIQFDRPIQGTVLGGVTLVKTAGSVPVPMSAQFSAGGTILTVVPNSILAPNTQYTVTVAGVVDAAGNAMAGSSARSFTTGASFDLTPPQVISVTPLYNSTVGTNPLLRMVFNKPINPISATSFAMYQFGIGRNQNGLSLVWSADLMSVTFNYPGPLDPNDRYYFYLNGFADLAGNTGNSSTQYFYTSSAVDSSPLTVTSVNPPNGVTGVPVNPAISIRLSKPVAPTSISNSSVTLVGVANTTVSRSSDGLALSLTLPGLLSANTSYTIQVAPGAFTDSDGNAVSAFSSTFTTSVSGLSDTSNGGVSLTDPSPGSTGVALNKVITVTFSKPFNPNSLVQDSFVLCIANNCSNRIAGTVAIVDANHLSFTPASNLPPGSTISVYVSNVTDLAGNNFNNPSLYNATFTTAAVADNTPPAVTNMTPANGATGVGPFATVALTFNKSLDQNTVNTSNFALYQGSSNLGASVSISADRRTVYLSVTLPFNANITVSANTDVKDYAGNSMANPYLASFTTEPQPLSFNPSVIQVRPGNGAPLDNKITIFTNSQIELTSAQNGVLVAQNGALIPGTVSLTADLHGIVWTPSSNYQPGAYIEVYVTSTVTDLNFNSINAYNFAFTTQAAACTAPAITAYNPGKYSSGNGNNYITNPVIEVQFCEPIDPATVTSSSFKVTVGSGPGGAAVPGTISFLNNNTVIRFTPSGDLPTAAYTYVQLTNAIHDMGANAFAGDGYYFYTQTTAVHDNAPLTVSSVTPVNNATAIGDNAPVRIVFSKYIDGLTATPATVTLNGGAIPYTYTFGSVNSSQTVMTITPLVPLPDSATITVHVSSGVTDLTGAASADLVSTFQTGAGANFNGPVIIQRSIDNGNSTGVPVNTTFTMTFDHPLDPSTVVGNPSGNNGCCFFYYDSSSPGGYYYPPATVNLSADLRTVTIVPSAPLTPSIGNMRYYWQGATDLSGNAMQNGNQFFTTGAGTDTTQPTVLQSNPSNTATNVPTNVVPEIIFNEAVRGTSLGSVTLNGSPVAAVLSSAYTNGTVVRLVPSALLAPGTTYTVAASGVQDVAGNTMAGTFTFSFTTGANFNVVGPAFQSATVTTATPATVPLPQNTIVSNVLKTNPTFTFTWDTGIDYASLLAGAVWLTDTSNVHVNIPVTFVQSLDQKTVTVQVNGTLNASTTYRMWVHYSSYPFSLTGVPDYSQRMFPFTTEP
jgi:hypothetical protein